MAGEIEAEDDTPAPERARAAGVGGDGRSFVDVG
jgi:hypothetical protein